MLQNTFIKKICSDNRQYSKFVGILNNISENEKYLIGHYDEYVDKNNYSCIEFKNFYIRGYLSLNFKNDNFYFYLQNIDDKTYILTLAQDLNLYLDNFKKYKDFLGGYKLIDNNTLMTKKNYVNVFKKDYLKSWKIFIKDFYIQNQLKNKFTEFDSYYGLSFEYDTCCYFDESGSTNKIKLLPFGMCLVYNERNNTLLTTTDKINFLNLKMSELVIYIINKLGLRCKVNNNELICEEDNFLKNDFNKF